MNHRQAEAFRLAALSIIEREKRDGRTHRSEKTPRTKRPRKPRAFYRQTLKAMVQLGTWENEVFS